MIVSLRNQTTVQVISFQTFITIVFRTTLLAVSGKALVQQEPSYYTPCNDTG